MKRRGKETLWRSIQAPSGMQNVYPPSDEGRLSFVEPSLAYFMGHDFNLQSLVVLVLSLPNFFLTGSPGLSTKFQRGNATRRVLWSF